VLGFKVSLPTIILTFVVFTGGMQFESADVAYGQENEIMNEANELIAAANAVNITDANIVNSMMNSMITRESVIMTRRTLMLNA